MFMEQWLQLDALPEMDSLLGDARYQSFADGFEPSADTRENMIRDVLDLTQYYIWETEGSLDDLLLSDLNFASTEDVATLYGGVDLRAPDEPPTPLEAGDRVGLLTRPALVASSTSLTHPILKGVFIRRRILCDPLGSPPADLGELPEVDALSSQREYTEALTEREGTSCVGCHKNINALGYPTENFDALGRSRDEEPVYDEYGTLLGIRPIDTQGVPQVIAGDETSVAGAHDLVDLILESGKVEACLARYWHRFSFAHTEKSDQDACVLAALEQEFRKGTSLADAFKLVALRPEFQLRRL